MSNQPDIMATTEARLEQELATIDRMFDLAHNASMNDELLKFSNDDWAIVAAWEKHLRNCFMGYYEDELFDARQKAMEDNG